MTTVVVRVFFDLCRAEISKIRAPTPMPGQRWGSGIVLPSIRSRVHEYAMRRIRSLSCRARHKQPRHHIAAKQRDELAVLLLRSQFCLI
jgi:hypothetical protein